MFRLAVNENPKQLSVQLDDQLEAYGQELTNLEHAELKPDIFKKERDALAIQYAPFLLEILKAASNQERFLFINKITTSLEKTLVTFDWSFLLALTLSIWEMPNVPNQQYPIRAMDKIMYAVSIKSGNENIEATCIALQLLLLAKRMSHQPEHHGRAIKNIDKNVTNNKESLNEALYRLCNTLRSDQEKNNFKKQVGILAQAFSKNPAIKDELLAFSGAPPSRPPSPSLTDNSNVKDILSYLNYKSEYSTTDRIRILDILNRNNVSIEDEGELSGILSVFKVLPEQEHLIIDNDEDAIKYYSYVLFNLCVLHYKYKNDNSKFTLIKGVIDNVNDYLERKGIIQILLNKYSQQNASKDQIKIASRYANAFRYLSSVDHSLLESLGKNIVAHPSWKEDTIVSPQEVKFMAEIKHYLLDYLKEFSVNFYENQHWFVYQLDGVIKIDIQGERFVFNIEYDGLHHQDEAKQIRDSLRDFVLSKHGIQVIRIKSSDAMQMKQYVILTIVNFLLKKYQMSIPAAHSEEEFARLVKGGLNYIQYKMIIYLNEISFGKNYNENETLKLLYKSLYALHQKFIKLMETSGDPHLFDELKSLYTAMQGIRDSIGALEKCLIQDKGTKAMVVHTNFVGPSTAGNVSPSTYRGPNANVYL